MANLCVLLRADACSLMSASGCVKLLISYVKPMNLLITNPDEETTTNPPSPISSLVQLNQDLVEMLRVICSLLNVYYTTTPQETSISADQIKLVNTLVYDLVACLNLNTKCSLSESNKLKLRPFYATLFELLATLLSNTNEQLVETYLIIVSKCWPSLAKYLLGELTQDVGDDATQ